VAAPAAAGGSPLRGASAGGGAAAISQAELDVIVSAAISQWNAGSKLRNVRVQVADLPGSYLGLAYNDLVLIDSDAAGHGWFVDSTPETSDDLDSARIDLLSAVVHELGHVLGLDDAADADDVMGEVLDAGVRRTSGIDAVDSVFAEIG